MKAEAVDASIPKMAHDQDRWQRAVDRIDKLCEGFSEGRLTELRLKIARFLEPLGAHTDVDRVSRALAVVAGRKKKAGEVADGSSGDEAAIAAREVIQNSGLRYALDFVCHALSAGLVDMDDLDGLGRIYNEALVRGDAATADQRLGQGLLRKRGDALAPELAWLVWPLYQVLMWEFGVGTRDRCAPGKDDWVCFADGEIAPALYMADILEIIADLIAGKWPETFGDLDSNRVKSSVDKMHEKFSSISQELTDEHVRRLREAAGSGRPSGHSSRKDTPSAR